MRIDTQMLSPSLVTFALAAIAAGCGQMRLTEPKSPGESSSSGEMRVERTAGAELPAFSLTRATQCRIDEGTRELQVHLSDPAQGATVELAVVGFRTQAAEYQCEQGANNGKEKGHIGIPFDGCMVRAEIPAAAHPGGSDLHATCRLSPEERLFQYGGRCRILISKVDSKVEGSFLCTRVPRIKATNLPASDDDDAVVDLTGQFTCEPQGAKKP